MTSSQPPPSPPTPSTLNITASQLNEILGVDCGAGQQLYRLRETLGEDILLGCEKYVSPELHSLRNNAKLPWRVPFYASPVVLDNLQALGAQASLRESLTHASRCDSREALQRLAPAVRTDLFQNNAILEQACAQTWAKGAYAFGESCVEQLRGHVVLVMTDSDTDVDVATRALWQVERGAVPLPERTAAEVALARDRISGLRSLLVRLGSLEHHVKGVGRRSYGQIAEAACLKSWNSYFDQEIQQCRVTSNQLLAPGVRLRGRPDGRFADGSLVEIKFRVQRFSTHGKIRASEMLQVHAYMKMQAAARALLVEGIKTDEMILLREHEVTFDHGLWGRVVASLQRFQGFRARLEVDPLFCYAFFAMPDSARRLMLRDAVAFSLREPQEACVEKKRPLFSPPSLDTCKTDSRSLKRRKVGLEEQEVEGARVRGR